MAAVTTVYPWADQHVVTGPDDVDVTPARLHPAFHGSFDWHSCVHGYWLLLTTRRLFPDLPVAPRVKALLDEMLTEEKAAGELAYLDRAYTGGFERPYGWAWLLALHREAQRHDEDWADVLAPLARAFAERFHLYLGKLTYPIRVGTHFSSAFAMLLALDWAEANEPGLADLIRARAQDCFAFDRDCQAWEPGGDEFLSSALTEALLMRRALPERAFVPWLHGFLPRLAERRPKSLFTPAFVSDRSDGKIAHLDGLNLSRGWCWRAIAAGLPASHPVQPIAAAAAAAHLQAALPHVTGDYMGEHWLASFALLALCEAG